MYSEPYSADRGHHRADREEESKATTPRPETRPPPVHLMSTYDRFEHDDDDGDCETKRELNERPSPPHHPKTMALPDRRRHGAVPTAAAGDRGFGSVAFPQADARTRAKIRRAQRDALLRRRETHLQARPVLRSDARHHHHHRHYDDVGGGGQRVNIPSETNGEERTARTEGAPARPSSGFRSPNMGRRPVPIEGGGAETAVDADRGQATRNGEAGGSIRAMDGREVIGVRYGDEGGNDVYRVDDPRREKKLMQWRDTTTTTAVPTYGIKGKTATALPTDNGRFKRTPSNLAEILHRNTDDDDEEPLADARVQPSDVPPRNNPTTDDATTNDSITCDWNDPLQKKKFLMAPCPKEAGVVKCYVRRTKAALFPEYHVYLKDCDTFLMKSKKRPKKKCSNYLISTDPADRHGKHGPDVLGKLRANFVGTEFQIYDAGRNPKRLDPFSGDYGGGNGCSCDEDARSELGSIIYVSNIMGNRGPRKMRVCLNRVDEHGTSTRRWQPVHEDEGMMQCFKHRSDTAVRHLEFYENRQPRWNDDMGAYVLNFNGRVTMASVKNFQITEEGNPGASEILQFGRAAKNEFAMDVRYPMSLFQAFAIILSACDSKIACD